VREEEGSAARLLALSDGVFAIAMTLLALDIAVPVGLSSAGFEEALGDVMPSVWAYVLSFLVIAAFWRGHHQVFRYVEKVDGTVIKLGLLSLGLIALMPFPTTLLAEYGDLPESVAVYSGAVAVMGDMADLAVTVLVFATAVPLAYVSPTGAKLWWAVLIPVKWVTGERGARLRAAAGNSTPEGS
jgi:uncharacterized membrane protein